MSFGARAAIRLDALRSNFDTLRNTVPGSKIMAAVKANAYGHGLTGISRELPDADALAVARLSEAVQLRAAGIPNRVVLMGGAFDARDLNVAAENSFDLVVHTDAQVAPLEQFAGAQLRVWLKVDTGMNRLGVRPESVSELGRRLRNCVSVESLGLMTHLANADNCSDPMSEQQFLRFEKLTSGFEGDVSIANSAALLGWADSISNRRRWNNRGELWIRPGLSLYGVSPLVGRTASDLGLRPVMHFETSLIAVKPICAGETVGYGGTWRASADSVIGIAAAGYGDGYSRFISSGTPVLVNGRRVPLAGVVSMDLLAVDLGAGSADRIGDPVVLWGDGLPVEEVARCADTTAYPLLTGVIDREGNVT